MIKSFPLFLLAASMGSAQADSPCRWNAFLEGTIGGEVGSSTPKSSNTSPSVTPQTSFVGMGGGLHPGIDYEFLKVSPCTSFTIGAMVGFTALSARWFSDPGSSTPLTLYGNAGTGGVHPQ